MKKINNFKEFKEKSFLNDLIIKNIKFSEKNTPEDFVNFIYKNNLGFLLYEESQNNYFSFFIDIGKLYKKFTLSNLLKYFSKGFSQADTAQIINYVEKEILNVVPNTFLSISNIEFQNWFAKDSLISAVLNAYPNYNIFNISNNDIDDEDIQNSNDEREYSFESNIKVDKESWYYNYVSKYQVSNESFIYSIARYPDLLEVYDDYRNKTIPMILPINNALEEKEEYKGKGIEITLDGFESKNNLYFNSCVGASTKALLYEEVDFYSFYDAEISLDLFNVFEGARVYNINDKTYQSLFFYTYNDNEENIYDLSLREGIPNCLYEDKMVSDIYTVVPIRYDNLDILKANLAQDNNFVANNVITGLAFQDNYEFGNDSGNIVNNSERVERIDLGTAKIFITEEPHYNYYKKTPTCVIEDKPISIRMIATIDKETHTGVLHLLNLGVKVKPTKYLDEITRNGLALKVDDNDKTFEQLKCKTTDTGEKIVNLYNYLEKKFNIKRVGIPRNLILSPFLNDGDFSNPDNVEAVEQLKSSILYGEAMFEEGEELGKIVDSTLKDKFKNKFGCSVYDYNTMNISKINILQYSDTYKDYLAERIDFAVVNLFYLELLQLEEASIQIANMGISNFIKDYKLNDKDIKTDTHNISSKLVLDRLEEIQEEYTKTLDFWDAQTNYYSSNVILSTIRKEFQIEKDVQILKRNHKEIQQIYDNRQQNLSRRSGIILSIVGVIFTLLNILEIYTAAVKNPEEAQYLSPFERFIFENISVINVIRIALLCIFAFYLIKFISRVSFNRKMN